MMFFYWPIIFFLFFKTIINESKLIEYFVTEKKKERKILWENIMMSRCVIVLIENDVIIVEVGENEFIIYLIK
jgi:hypothetical protein